MSMNLNGFRPMKSASPEQDFDWSTLFQGGQAYLVSPKYDGWRCVIHPELGPVSNTLKPIRNTYTREWLAKHSPKWLDGELCVMPINHANQMQMAQSAFSAEHGQPDFRYMVFDNFEAGQMCGFGIRSEDTKTVRDVAFKKWQDEVLHTDGAWWRIQLAPQHRVETVAELLELEEKYLAEGYEGVMVRSLDGKYKFGRSTLVQRGMIKMKRYIDAEAVVQGWSPLLLNQNDPKIDALGLQKRGFSKDGKIPDDSRVGSLLCKVITGRFKDTEFSIGSGFDDAARSEMREQFRTHEIFPDIRYADATDMAGAKITRVGQIMTFKYQDHGSKDTVRQPIFKSWRSTDDIS